MLGLSALKPLLLIAPVGGSSEVSGTVPGWKQGHPSQLREQGYQCYIEARPT